MRFGIYPGGAVGTDDGTIVAGTGDDPRQVRDLLEHLRGGRSFHVRGYAQFTDERDASDTSTQAPSQIEDYVPDGCAVDLVLQYQSTSGDVEGFANFVRTMIAAHAPRLESVQIGEEVNVRDNPTLDGYYPRADEAVVAGVAAARAAVDLLGINAMIGTNTTQLLGDPTFYERLVATGGPGFVDALDYIGLDTFPDVFVPAPAHLSLPDLCSWVLVNHREQSLAPAGLNHLPLFITEHGWPTGDGRSEERQEEMLTAMVGAAQEPNVNVQSYTHFCLRDATDEGSLFGSFGLTDASYRPKPAFHAYARFRAAQPSS